MSQRLNITECLTRLHLHIEEIDPKVCSIFLKISEFCCSENTTTKPCRTFEFDFTKVDTSRCTIKISFNRITNEIVSVVYTNSFIFEFECCSRFGNRDFCWCFGCASITIDVCNTVRYSGNKICGRVCKVHTEWIYNIVT